MLADGLMDVLLLFLLLCLQYTAAELATQIITTDPTTGLATITAQVTCYDPHSGIQRIDGVMNVGTYPGGDDVVAYYLTPLFGSDHRLAPAAMLGVAAFTGVQGNSLFDKEDPVS